MEILVFTAPVIWIHVRPIMKNIVIDYKYSRWMSMAHPNPIAVITRLTHRPIRCPVITHGPYLESSR